MGVPKFYRWMSERYPKINQIVTDSALLPEFDHLYLDMNGIIHGCTHPPHLDVSQVLSEREMMLGIMNYLDRIITQIVKPKVSVYMAIDGVAPRAKLNQQRSRRFRSAKDMAEAHAQLPEEDRPKPGTAFDSNCITPGTDFLAKVSEVIKYFIRSKLHSDPLWQHLTVIFSGHDVPGEGEHKIMQHLRNIKAQPHYAPNTRHCIYGQDADLIMLGLVTHEPHFTILREVIDFKSFFGQKNTLKMVKKFTKGNDFQLLHLSLVREYLYYEFIYNHQNDETAPYDLERIIDDFVFITFLVGNDFLPHMPTLDIGEGAFDLLFDIYKRQRVSLWQHGDYLTYKGEISDAHRLEVFLHAIGAVEAEILSKREDDKKKKRRGGGGNGKSSENNSSSNNNNNKNDSYTRLIETMIVQHPNADDYVEGWKPVADGEKDFKGRYYYEKLQMTPINKDEHFHLRKSYMEGLIWCLAYYYKGCISWGWFYPYHYGPMLSDLVDLPRIFSEIKFDLGEPLSPFEQLMGCLPPASAALVPKPYHWLMTSPKSPIIQFYPTEFEIDMNGKKNPWEGVNLLPFIDIKLLKETLKEYCPPSMLTPEERKRNEFGVVYFYRYDPTNTDTIKSPLTKIGLSDIVNCQSSVTIDEQSMSYGEPFAPVLVEGTKIPYPGFPSLTVIPIASADLVNVGLNCFGMTSKHPTIVLKLHNISELLPIELLANNLLGQSVYINWPMMHEGRVVALSDAKKEACYVQNKPPKITDHTDVASTKWKTVTEEMQQTYLEGNGVPGSGGIDIGDIKVRLKLLPLQGMKVNPSNGSRKKVFGNEVADVPLQLALWKAPAPDPRFIERGPLKLEDRFPVNCKVVLTKGKYRGCKGTVVGIADKKHVGVKVQVIPAETPFGLAIARTVQESYLSSADAARALKMNPGLFGKITGRLQFEQKRYDLGLNLKSADGSCVVGYTRKKEMSAKHHDKDKKKAWNAGDSVLVIGSARTESTNDDKEDRIQWEYTPRAVRLVEEYRRKFPQLFAAIAKAPNEKKYDADTVFGEKGEAWLPVVRDWLDKHESAKLPRSPVTTHSMSYEAIGAVQKSADVRTLALKKRGYPKEVLIKVPASALYSEGSTGATDILQVGDMNENEAPELGDRIVNLCADGIPFGARGTVVGIHEAETTGSVEVVMDEEFMGGNDLQGACSMFRGKLCLWVHLLKITPGNSKAMLDRLVPKSSGQTAVNKIMSSIEQNVKNDNSATTTLRSSWDGNVDAMEETIPTTEVKQAPIMIDPATNPAQAGTASRFPADSDNRASSTTRTNVAANNETSKRGKQGTWREALGPPDKGHGFKNAQKSGTSGIKKWKNYVASQQKQGSETVNDSTAALKSMLGVSPNQKSAPKEVIQNAKSVASDSEQLLKSMLGLNLNQNDNANVHATTGQNIDASEGLKAMLGITGVETQPSNTVQMSAPTSAADKLMQLMCTKQAAPVMSPTMHVPPHRPAFNFTYVEEGQEVPEIASFSPVPTGYPGFAHNHIHYTNHTPIYGRQFGYGDPPPASALPIPPVSMQDFPPLRVEPNHGNTAVNGAGSTTSNLVPSNVSKGKNS